MPFANYMRSVLQARKEKKRFLLIFFKYINVYIAHGIAQKIKLLDMVLILPGHSQTSITINA
jgi:hypothetical protein